MDGSSQLVRAFSTISFSSLSSKNSGSFEYCGDNACSACWQISVDEEEENTSCKTVSKFFRRTPLAPFRMIFFGGFSTGDFDAKVAPTWDAADVTDVIIAALVARRNGMHGAWMNG